MSQQDDFIIENNILIGYKGDVNTKDIVIPEGVKDLGHKSLVELNMTSVTIPHSITSIENSFFTKCKNLKTINIPNTVNHIIFSALQGISPIENINIEEGNPYYKSIDGFVINNNDELLFCPRKKGGTINLPQGIKSIDVASLKGCVNITKLILPSSLEIIPNGALQGLTNLEYIEIGENVKEIDYSIFFNLKKLTNIQISQKNKVFKEIDGALYNLSENYLFKFDKERRGSFTIPSFVKKINPDVFINCSLDTIIVPSDINLCDTFTYSHSNSFYGCKNLKNIIFEDHNCPVHVEWFVSRQYDEKINTFAYFKSFAHCFYPNQIDVYLKSQLLDSICSALLEDKGISEEWKNDWLSYFKKRKKGLYKKIIAHNNILMVMTKFKLLSLTDVKELLDLSQSKNNVNISAELLNYENDNFSFKQIMREKQKELFIDPTSEKYLKKIWKYEIKPNDTIKIIGYKGHETNIQVPSVIGDKVVNEIAMACFSPLAKGIRKEQRLARQKIESIVLPDSIKYLGFAAFLGCFRLNNLVLSKNISEPLLNDNNDLDFWFYRIASIIEDCSNLPHIDIPTGMVTIPQNFFSKSNYLRSVTIPSSVKIIGAFSFNRCHKLNKVEIANGVEEICEGAFTECPSLMSIYIPPSVKHIHKKAFERPYITLIKGHEGSAAEKYALENNFEFEVI